MTAMKAKRWLEGKVTRGQPDWRPMEGLAMPDLEVVLAEEGRILCRFVVPKHLSDGEGNWSAGAVATMIDDIAAASIVTRTHRIFVSVDFSISYFSTAVIEEEVEIEGRLVGEGKGKLRAVEVKIRRTGGGGELVALGRQWMRSVDVPQSKL
ncbi:hypothetical protein QJS10_CPA07g00783 [Acorus calamus]|uniref:Thioesterase domain-containing protein n=1 Tax=Acorus calamus TaxID=4465 RepID=A0AAV9EFA4_ACOCL|nr:hypothetical protein QJS10_CPA07g00783 [Acorus calamus]